MKITKIKVSLELEGGTELVAALDQLVKIAESTERFDPVADVVLTATQQEVKELPLEPEVKKPAREATLPPHDRAQAIMARYVRGADYFKEVVQAGRYNILMWIYKVLVGLHTPASASTATKAMELLGFDRADKKFMLAWIAGAYD
jgi:hypothetical protein